MRAKRGKIGHRVSRHLRHHHFDGESDPLTSVSGNVRQAVMSFAHRVFSQIGFRFEDGREQVCIRLKDFGPEH